MCLKQNYNKTNDRADILANEIIRRTKELIRIVKRGRLEDNLVKYEVVKQQGIYNMLDPRARELAGISESTYRYIQKNYSYLMNKFPRTKVKAQMELDYMKSAEIAKMVALKGCRECRKIVSEKLDVTRDDLCQLCRDMLTEYKL